MMCFLVCVACFGSLFFQVRVMFENAGHHAARLSARASQVLRALPSAGEAGRHRYTCTRDLFLSLLEVSKPVCRRPVVMLLA